jgi:myo-inositol 2-dehydrogenase/D-chiro-inositol 1-dehydrogenase
MGQIRAPLLFANPAFLLVGCVDPNLAQASELSIRFRMGVCSSSSTSSFKGGGAPQSEAEDIAAWSTLSEALDVLSTIDNKPDCVVVSSPTSTHPTVFKECAAHGLHIFTEKPVGETSEMVNDLFDIAESNSIELCCGFQRRFDATYRAVYDSVNGLNATVGTPNMSTVVFHDHPTPSLDFLLNGGGSIFMDLAPHDVDYVTWVHDSPVKSVFAIGSSSIPELRSKGVYDYATILLELVNGSVSTINMSRSASYGYDQRFEIFGTKGNASVQNVSANSCVVGTSNGFHSPKLQHSFPQRFAEAFGAELEHFQKVVNSRIRGGSNGSNGGKEEVASNNNNDDDDIVTWPVGREQCAHVQKVADCCAKSARLGVRVVLADEP